MSDWRPYEPSLEAERSAAYERAALRAMKIGLQRLGRIVRTREEARELFGAGSDLAEGIPLPMQIVGSR